MRQMRQSSSDYFYRAVYNHFMKKEVKNHTGIYAVIVKRNKVLMIKKARGPYKGMYDLPGGSPEKDESQEETLIRELDEELGCKPQEIEFLITLEDTFDYVSSDESTKLFSHTGHYFTANIESEKIIKTVADGHDSLGVKWISFSDIKQKQITVPNIVYRAIDYCFKEEANAINKAIIFAEEKFKEGNKKNHYLDVFSILKEEFAVTHKDVLAASLLHDTLEDTSATYDEIKNVFGETVADLVDEVTHPKNYNAEQKLEYYEKIKHISSGAKLIKMADFTSHLRNFITIYERNEQHLYPKFKNNDKYIKSIREFLDTCEDSKAKKITQDLTNKLESLL